MAKETNEEKFSKLKKIGVEFNTDFEVSPQAKAIIERIDDFPVEHFKAWWKKHFGIIHGGHMHQYLSVEDGISQAKKVN